MTEVVVRGGTVVTPEGMRQADVAIEGGFIRAVEPEVPGGQEEIDARGLFVFPGLIDVHVHFNEPGHTEWEGAATGSRALAAGGGTLFFDMPLNSIPCTVNAREFDLKRSALEASSVTDFALWGGLVPGNVQEMEALAEHGVVGFKAFLCHSGLDEFPRVDDLTLWEGLREAARLGLPVAVHAENHELIAALSRRMIEQSRQGIRDFLESRPVLAELEAIQRATLLAGEAGARLHVIHISSGRGVLLAAEARQRGVDVSTETCPHYLFFTGEDVERLGAVAKCAPPVRDRKEQDNLWAELLGGNVDVIASDHSPSSPDRKAGEFWRAWGGIAGVQSTLAVLLDQGYHRRGLPLERIASLVAAEPARRFRIADRGRIVAGACADLVLVDLSATFTLKPQDLLQRHALSPYLGASFRGAVKRTIRRGETIFAEGKITAKGGGKLVRPVR
ncbi:MAG: allantoinase [Acidobacteria bacterium 13_1_40CM_2_56_5]|nr:MAG: allantoinase [Acidobacteria bacterium 13_1_40CM_2_56_5]